MTDLDKLARGLTEAECGICGGTGKVKAYRGPHRYLPCHFCKGTGFRKAYIERTERHDC